MTTLDTIHKLSTERFNLWRKAGSGGLTPSETSRVQALTNELANLWDTHRREVASENRSRGNTYIKKDKAA